MHYFAILLLVLLSSVTNGQTVTKVIDGVTVALDSGHIIKLKGCQLSADTAVQRKAKLVLQYLVLDRPVDLREIEETGWGEQIAVMKWRGKDIGEYMLRHGLAVRIGSSARINAPTPQIVTLPSEPPRFYYAPRDAYCVGNT